MSWIIVIGNMFALIGAVMLVMAGRRFTRTRDSLRNSVVTSGTVIALIENRDRNEISYFPKVKFQAPSRR